MKTQVYAVEKHGDMYQSVFPDCEAEFSQLHTSKDEAVAYIKSVNPKAEVIFD